jgi:hypothetical protein
MRKIIEDKLQKDIGETPFYRLIYRLVESDVRFNRICDFICDIAEGKFKKFNDDFVMCFENLFYFTGVIYEDRKTGHNTLSLERLSDFLWKVAQGQMTFVYGHIFEGKYHCVNISDVYPDFIRLFKFSFMERLKSDGTPNTKIDYPENAITSGEICFFFDRIEKYAEKFENKKKPIDIEKYHKVILENILSK